MNKDSSIVIIGANGQLGRALVELYPDATRLSSKELDLSNKEAICSYDWSSTDIIINAAAYTAVDEAETMNGRIVSWKINAEAVGVLARVANEYDITLVQVSTDYVFDGTKSIHTEDEMYTPINVYGQSKAAGDIAASLSKKHYIIRTSWVIGEGKNFVTTMKALAEQDIKPSVVADQFGRLTFTKDIAASINHLINSHAEFGIYNVSNEGEPSSWANVAKLVYELSGKSGNDVTEVTTDEYYSGKEGIAPRPLQSTLSLDKIESTGFTPRDWHEALTEYLAN